MSETLLQLLAQRDIGAYEQLYQRYYKPLVLFALRYIDDQPMAEDIVEDVVVAIWENASQFDTLNSLRSYLYSAVHNKCINALRHGNAHSRYEDEVKGTTSDVIDADSAHALEMQFVHLYEALNALPPRCREVMQLYIEGNRNAAIATRLSISIETVKKHRKRAMQLLRESMNKISNL